MLNIFLMKMHVLMRNTSFVCVNYMIVKQLPALLLSFAMSDRDLLNKDGLETSISELLLLFIPLSSSYIKLCCQCSNCIYFLYEGSI